MLSLGISIWRGILGRSSEASSPGGLTNVILLSNSSTSAILKSGGGGYIKRAG